MTSKTTKRFRDLFDARPDSVRHQAQEAFRLFRENPSHPGLRFKPISPSDPTIYSARIGLRYRAIGLRDGDTVLWIWIGSHADDDREITRQSKQKGVVRWEPALGGLQPNRHDLQRR